MYKRMAFFALSFCLLLLAQTASNISGAPETTLAGIDILHTTIPDVHKMYGEQEALYAVPPDPYPAGTKLYKWGRLTVTLKVLTEPSPSGEIIRAISVEGEGEPGKKPINRTGRGLSLGAKASEIKKLYGVEPEKGFATIKWADGTTLVVGLNNKDRVNKLELRAIASTAQP